MKTFVIAEAGSCHGGSLDNALRLISAAAAAGADACKFQFWSSADRLAARRHVPDEYREVYRQFALPASWLPELATACARQHVAFMATAYLPEDVATVEPFVAQWKLASFEAEARDLLDAHLPFIERDFATGRDRWLIVSLGMGGRMLCGDAGGAQRYLLCTSSYPAPVEALNLSRIELEDFDGFSDHSDPTLTLTGSWAVCAGATIIEAHLRLDDTDPGNPDAPHAMTPAQFADYVRLIRLAEVALGTGEKRSQPCEENMRHYRVGGEATHA